MKSAPHPTADLYRKERAQGKTYQEIADKYGVTKQAVSLACRQNTSNGFRVYTEKGCIYPNLRKWLNKNKVSRAQLARRMGMVGYHSTANRVGAILSGKLEPTKGTIDKLLQITGMKYETMFYIEKTKEDKKQ